MHHPIQPWYPASTHPQTLLSATLNQILVCGPSFSEQNEIAKGEGLPFHGGRVGNDQLGMQDGEHVER